MLLGEVPTAFHAGVHDILLIAFGLACAKFLGFFDIPGTAGAQIGIDVEAHGRNEEWDLGVDLSRTVGWFTTKYPVALAFGELSWAQVVAGEASAGGRDQEGQRTAAGAPGRVDLRHAALPQP